MTKREFNKVIDGFVPEFGNDTHLQILKLLDRKNYIDRKIKRNPKYIKYDTVKDDLAMLVKNIVYLVTKEKEKGYVRRGTNPN